MTIKDKIALVINLSGHPKRSDLQLSGPAGGQVDVEHFGIVKMWHEAKPID
ncbi:hypothetical protein N7E70_018520 [Aminobacter sp. NyZ550]|uniref:Uncharacterized protein n=1 Tax=Aminobacter ciceronei TaxID=150723 RepID=A0ABR6CFN2_9HYPH|nr:MULTISPECIES: hypothetical protein [Aminobacter]MBA8910080.1 hypothetical protein [Aminobacter ciceronei]MBA9023853.1 hypothetical protein [Aminobacter ciceronei]WAX93670.1 hypothetical protein N7E70_018520 [Aminobacter sp. NyZ550]WMC99553.1 hypothetical protein RAR13_12990 [Aminobacter aminovorans]